MSAHGEKQAAGGMDVFEAIRGNRSTRRFRDERVPDDVARRILDAGRRTGSAKNAQPWEFVLVRDRAQLRALAATGPFCAHVGGADCAIAIVMPDEARLGGFDAGRAFQNMILAAHALGVASCIGTPDPTQASEVLVVPAGRRAIQLLSLGYPAPGENRTIDGSPLALPTGRAPLDSLLHLDRYGNRPG